MALYIQQLPTCLGRDRVVPWVGRQTVLGEADPKMSSYSQYLQYHALLMRRQSLMIQSITNAKESSFHFRNTNHLAANTIIAWALARRTMHTEGIRRKWAPSTNIHAHVIYTAIPNVPTSSHACYLPETYSRPYLTVQHGSFTHPAPLHPPDTYHLSTITPLVPVR